MPYTLSIVFKAQADQMGATISRNFLQCGRLPIRMEYRGFTYRLQILTSQKGFARRYSTCFSLLPRPAH
ncbi:hypothetical protein ALQ46_200004 [Pseudomonas savastanoi pv. phaseolicola]|nr:hypothetical protein ALQ46_200004 [Pseudomonas savastanoi pv. phaseolicola]